MDVKEYYSEKIYQTGILSDKSYVNDEGKLLFPFTMSTSRLDRDAEIIDIETFDTSDFIKNPQAFYKHDRWNYGSIGLWYDIVKSVNTLNGAIWFHEKVDIDSDRNISSMCREYVEERILTTCSVGFKCHNPIFLPISNDNTITLPNQRIIQINPVRANEIRNGWRKGVYFLSNCELIECSIVDIPANPDAIAKNYKEKIKLLHVERNMNLSEFKYENGIVTMPDEVKEWLDLNNLIVSKVGATISRVNKEKLTKCHGIIEKSQNQLIESTDILKEFIEMMPMEEEPDKSYDEALDEINEKLDKIISNSTIEVNAQSMSVSSANDEVIKIRIKN